MSLSLAKRCANAIQVDCRSCRVSVAVVVAVAVAVAVAVVVVCVCVCVCVCDRERGGEVGRMALVCVSVYLQKDAATICDVATNGGVDRVVLLQQAT